MPASTSAATAGCLECHQGTQMCHLCQPLCPLISCTPIDTLPGYQDQQRLPLPPLPRERGRSRVTRGRPPPAGPPPVFCSPVILSTSTPAEHSSSLNGFGYKWRPRRRRSASARQRQGASLIREVAPPSEVDNCPLCQPRYSKSPERLRMRPAAAPPQPLEFFKRGPAKQPHRVSYGDLLNTTTAKQNQSMHQPSTTTPTAATKNGKARVRRSRSEFRQQPQLKLSNDENVNPLNLHPNHGQRQRDYNGNCNIDSPNSDYAELSEKLSRRASIGIRPRVSRSKSRGGGGGGGGMNVGGGLGGHNCGVLTVWPGKTGIWLPQ